MSSYRLLIDGRLVAGAASLDVINPATGKVFASCARADESQLNQAVAAAKRAFPAWSASSFTERQTRLDALAQALDAQTAEFAHLLTLEQGKPVDRARSEITATAAALRFFGKLRTETRILRENTKEKILEIRKPLGVVAAITPWNFPVLLMGMKLAPALVMGNTVVVKPAPTTPLTTLKFGELAAEILPPGVLNIITDDNDLGPVLTAHPDVAKVSFTGSTATGKRVMASVASTLKRLTLELGGNDVALVLDDADVKAVAPKLFRAAMANSGQVCTAIKRVYVHSSLYQVLCDELARLANEAVVGNGLEPGVTIGPVQNRRQYDRVMELITEAATAGNVIAGGKPLDREGYFIPPTIVKDIPDTARLVCEEQFGPVLPVLQYDDLTDAVARINASVYGLGGSVWTTNIQRGIEVASLIDSGTVWVNKAMELPFDIPFRGAKQSGLGGENGEEAINAYTQARIINVAL